jgi:hypothetical protein
VTLIQPRFAVYYCNHWRVRLPVGRYGQRVGDIRALVRDGMPAQ